MRVRELGVPRHQKEVGDAARLIDVLVARGHLLDVLQLGASANGLGSLLV